MLRIPGFDWAYGRVALPSRCTVLPELRLELIRRSCAKFDEIIVELSSASLTSRQCFSDIAADMTGHGRYLTQVHVILFIPAGTGSLLRLDTLFSTGIVNESHTAFRGACGTVRKAVMLSCKVEMPLVL